jgi:hypothetical protein
MLTTYLFCCKRSNRKDYQSSDLYEYDHLNPNGILININTNLRKFKSKIKFNFFFSFEILKVDDENISLTQGSFTEEMFGLSDKHKTTSLTNMLIDSDDKTVFIDLNNNNNSNSISRFVNKQQTDIRNLLN